MECGSYSDFRTAIGSIGSDVGRTAGSKVYNRILLGKAVDLFQPVNKLSGPLSVFHSLLTEYLSCAFIAAGKDSALCKTCNTLGVCSALTKNIAFHARRLIRIGTCGGRCGSDTKVLGRYLVSPCGGIALSFP